ncbi:hypothetical protein ElyMa_004144400 [Elysia marginata]|uniref:Uncharacterized protein n=1 Tax=Elysia marginata TaxID=1093978 RepID=A0AAV4GET5_9GAST|nr:hypothetical protein ElyMa_004144400 [Elysia marginata]
MGPLRKEHNIQGASLGLYELAMLGMRLEGKLSFLFENFLTEVNCLQARTIILCSILIPNNCKIWETRHRNDCFFQVCEERRTEERRTERAAKREEAERAAKKEELEAERAAKKEEAEHAEKIELEKKRLRRLRE